MSLKATFSTSKSAETEGVLVDICDNADGSVCRWRIARAGRRNKAYTKALDKATRPYRAIMNEIDSDLDDKIMAKVIAESIVLDWENTQLEEGINLPFSKENVMLVLTTLPDLIDVVNRKAGEMSTFRDQQLEDEAKN